MLRLILNQRVLCLVVQKQVSGNIFHFEISSNLRLFLFKINYRSRMNTLNMDHTSEHLLKIRYSEVVSNDRSNENPNMHLVVVGRL